ncbi:MAG: hypothetical protein C0391_09305 [Anaerolinea sp.]|nr:hypothetical protein [Anaerolinea sp.]
MRMSKDQTVIPKPRSDPDHSRFASTNPESKIADPKSEILTAQSDLVNILMVDDRQENLMALESVLEPLGQNLVHASSGREALRALLKQEFAVILLDVQMPGMDGFETAALIRERERSRDTPIIFLTAVSKSDMEIIQGYTAGAVDYVLKPFVPEILKAKVAAFVKMHRMSEQVRQQAELLAALNFDLEAQIMEVERLNHKLLMANEELEAFSHSVSHDLRAPLRHIIAFSKILIEDYAGQLDADGQKHLERIGVATTRMDQLIEDLLKLSRVNRAEMNFQPVNLSALVKDIAASLQIGQPERQVEWKIAADLTAQGDARLLRAALENLLGNAWKYTSKKEKAVIEFGMQIAEPVDSGSPQSAAPSLNSEIYYVRDNGAGFDMAYVDKLFSAFQRLHSESEFTGTGIGLSIVRRILQRHGGRIWAEGKVGEGAVFYFTITESEFYNPQSAIHLGG